MAVGGVGMARPRACLTSVLSEKLTEDWNASKAGISLRETEESQFGQASELGTDLPSEKV